VNAPDARRLHPAAQAWSLAATTRTHFRVAVTDESYSTVDDGVPSFHRPNSFPTCSSGSASHATTNTPDSSARAGWLASTLTTDNLYRPVSTARSRARTATRTYLPFGVRVTVPDRAICACSRSKMMARPEVAIGVVPAWSRVGNYGATTMPLAIPRSASSVMWVPPTKTVVVGNGAKANSRRPVTGSEPT
jgi:hypothetical protein